MEVAAVSPSRLRERRHACGFVLQQLAVLSGVSITTIVSIEKWGHQATYPTYEKLATALGTTVEDLWPGMEEQLVASHTSSVHNMTRKVK